ncbi:flagellar hook-associated protein FlgK [Bacillus sp. M6-12]|uniref:flagellar hook-associated protein FlgK n=1 Tax=Bacillus sp. M6-12 TaxID=2054166 RepID=UPI000C78FD6C|nr:flagellar hook-associated protein FlgK [Bacillus sp. M6-12]PLS17869.1 flagellar hook-associated protein FlgK [Bacillus sp. M6-12]
MISTFHALEVARRGMLTQQAALFTTGHNIANANTPGYTRQRVNFVQTEPYPSASMNRPQIPGQMGTGVKAGDIQRIRDSFVDMQFRGENSKLGFWQSKAELLSQMEDVMNEQTDTGLAGTMDQFWEGLQDLAVQPQNDGARRVVRERGITLANTFNYTYNSLKAIQKDYRSEIDNSQDQINSLLRQINNINKQVADIEPHGYLPNDLYDERDRLIDELSSMMNIKVEAKATGGNSSANAEGIFDIYLATSQGDILTDSNVPPNQIKLVDATAGKANGIHIMYENRAVLDSPVTSIKFFELKQNESGFMSPATDTDADNDASPVYKLTQFTDLNASGKLKGYIEGYGYKSDPTPADSTNGDDIVKGLYNDMLADLDEMAYTFASHFNLVHRSGWSLNEIWNGASNDKAFFSFGGAAPSDSNPKGAAANLKVADAILDDVENIAAAAEGNVIAGSMIRNPVAAGTVGNVSITGIYEPESAPASFTNAKEIKVVVKFTTDNQWTYELKGIDSNGAEIATATQTGSFTGKNPEKVFGVTLDPSKISSQQNGDTWTYTFSASGVKSSDEAFIGNGSNALELSKVKDAMLDYGGDLTNVQSFYQGMIGRLGDNSSEALRMSKTAGVLKDSVEQRRMSISNVSLDEEMTNMIKFQHAYNAAARNITLVDEMLDKIINGMGVGGR